LQAKQSQEEMSKKWDADGIPLEDTNMAGVGGEEDKALRKAAAGGEPAWEGVGLEPGVWVWRIESFKVVPWPKEKYGKFHEGDSYIVLQTEYELEEETGQPSEKLQHDIHFWLGKKTSTDERGTAAYKTVELDDFFDGSAVQHRETQGHESEAFASYFPDGLQYLAGGVESGFKVTQQDVFEKDIIQVRRANRKIVYEEEQVQLSTLNHRDAFILSVGREVFVWFGENCSPFVKQAANSKAEKKESESEGEYTVVPYASALDEQKVTFWKALGVEDGAEPPSDKITAADAVPPEVEADFGEGILYSVQIGEDRSMSVTEVGRGELNRSMLDPTAVMMVDTRTEIFLWLGRESSKTEKASAFGTATNYLKMNDRNIDSTSITILKDGNARRNKTWLKMFPL